MIVNELNTNLIEAAKEKFPAKGQLANILMDTLYMGKEANSGNSVQGYPQFF